MTSAHSDDPFLYPSIAARKTLAVRLGLPFHSQMQDWDWEVADQKRFEEFIEVYRSGDISDSERHSLMEILIQCVEDMGSGLRFDSAWGSIEPLLVARSCIHRSTVEYWACLEGTEPDMQFQVSRNMRKVWSMIST